MEQPKIPNTPPAPDAETRAYLDAVQGCAEFYQKILKGDLEKTDKTVAGLGVLIKNVEALAKAISELVIPRATKMEYDRNLFMVHQAMKHIRIWEKNPVVEMPHAEGFVWHEGLIGKKISTAIIEVRDDKKKGNQETRVFRVLSDLAREYGKEKMVDLIREWQIVNRDPRNRTEVTFEITRKNLFLLEGGELVAPIFMVVIERALFPDEEESTQIELTSFDVEDRQRLWDEHRRFFVGWVVLPELGEGAVKDMTIVPEVAPSFGAITGLDSGGDMVREIKTTEEYDIRIINIQNQYLRDEERWEIVQLYKDKESIT